jgi:hypothetical protein
MSLTVKRPSTKGLPSQLAMALCNAPRDASAFSAHPRPCPLSCTQWRHGSARTCSLHCTLTPAACAARSARSVPGQDTRSGQGALARRHTDGPLWAALLKTTVMCEAWRRRTIAPPDPCRTADRPKPNSPHNWVLDTDTGTGPIPPITVSKVNAYSGGVLARALPEGLRYLST